MCKCRSHGTFPLFGLQSSHLNICYYHQDLHRRPLRPGSRPGFYGDRRALLLIGAWPLPRRPGIGHALKRHPFSGLVDSAVLLTKNGPLGALDSVARLNEAAAPSYLFKADARSTLVPKHAETARAGFHDRGDDVSTGVSKARAWAATTIRVGPRPEPIGGPALAVPHPTGAHRRPPSVPSRQFQALFDSLFKVLFIFPSRTAPRGATGSGHDGALTLSGANFHGTWARSVAEDASPDYNSDAEGDRFSSWAIPGSLAVTKGILAGFDNDPSAGSPTETLLRLLLPLNDKVQWTSRDVAGSEPPTSPRSEHFTGPFNRQTAPPTKNGHAPPPIESRKSSQSVNPYYVWTWINQVAFLRDVRPACSSTHYLGRGEAITGQDHRSCRGTKCTSYERPGPRPYAHEIFRIQKHDRASMHRRGRIMPTDTLGTSSTTEVHQAATRSLDEKG
ncbi:hypothetical protein V6N13_028709 [Hibiscus sabdariffa]